MTLSLHLPPFSLSTLFIFRIRYVQVDCSKEEDTANELPPDPDEGLIIQPHARLQRWQSDNTMSHHRRHVIETETYGMKWGVSTSISHDSFTSRHRENIFKRSACSVPSSQSILLHEKLLNSSSYNISQHRNQRLTGYGDTGVIDTFKYTRTPKTMHNYKNPGILVSSNKTGCQSKDSVCVSHHSTENTTVNNLNSAYVNPNISENNNETVGSESSRVSWMLGIDIPLTNLGASSAEMTLLF